MENIDDVDRKILQTLLKDARSKMVDIAKDCGVSVTTIKNRIERLKKTGIIVKEEMMLEPAFFGYPYPVMIGVNLSPDKEDHICNLIRKEVKLVSIDHFVGHYDLSIFAFAKTLKELTNIKELILKQKGVNNVELVIWNKVHFHFENFIL